MECGPEFGKDVVRIEGNGVIDRAEMREMKDAYLVQR